MSTADSTLSKSEKCSKAQKDRWASSRKEIDNFLQNTYQVVQLKERVDYITNPEKATQEAQTLLQKLIDQGIITFESLKLCKELEDYIQSQVSIRNIHEKEIANTKMSKMEEQMRDNDKKTIAKIVELEVIISKNDEKITESTAQINELEGVIRQKDEKLTELTKIDYKKKYRKVKKQCDKREFDYKELTKIHGINLKVKENLEYEIDDLTTRYKTIFKEKDKLVREFAEYKAKQTPKNRKVNKLVIDDTDSNSDSCESSENEN